MKILFLGPVPPDLGSNNTGGIARHVWSLANKLNEEGNDVSIIAIGRYYKQNRIMNGIRVFGIDNVFKASLFTLIQSHRLLFEVGIVPIKKAYLHALYSLFRMNAIDGLNKYDIIHLHGSHNAALYGLKVLGIKKPKIVTIHSYTDYISADESKNVERMSQMNNYLKLSDGIVHVSKTDKKKGQRYGLHYIGEDRVIYNGIEEGRNKKFDSKPGICFVGYLILSKRISLFLESIKYIKSKIEKVKIAGDGTKRQEVELAARSNPIISYLGVIQNKEVRKMMNQYSLLVVPSLSESFGLVYIEALFEGMAVLGYEPIIDEYREVMNLSKDEKKLLIGISTDKISPRELAHIIDSTFEFRQTDRGKQAMRSLQKKAIKNFEWNAVINKTNGFYNQLIKENSITL